MIDELLTLPCTLVLRTGTGTIDDDGREVLNVSEVDTVCELQQRGRTEASDEGELSDTTWLLVLPAGAPPVDSGDRAVVNGQVFEFFGAPWRARDPRTGLEHHVECTVRRTAGEDTAS